MSLEAEDVARSAQGRWSGILSGLGVDDRYLQNRHGPCPMCGGKDRYRFDDKEGQGTWYCNSCGAGRPFKLLMNLNGWSFPETLKQVATLTGTIEPEAPKAKGDPKAAIERLLSGCATGREPVWGYLQGRGLSAKPNELKFHPACEYVDGKFKAPFPAMLAAMRNQKGKLVSVHRTYLGNVNVRKKCMPPIGTLKGSAIRLFPHGETLGVAEGIETAIAAHELFGRPVWATYCAQNLECFIPPEGVKNVIVFGDTDESFTGQASAYLLAKKLKIKGYNVAVKLPSEGDWLDVLNHQQRAA